MTLPVVKSKEIDFRVPVFFSKKKKKRKKKKEKNKNNNNNNNKKKKHFSKYINETERFIPHWERLWPGLNAQLY